MPRIYTSASEPLDFCKRCFPKDETKAEAYYGNVEEFGEGPDGRGNCFGYDCEHPPYDDDPDMYRCHKCNKILTDDRDDY